MPHPVLASLAAVPPGSLPPAGEETFGLWPLFVESFDLFTILLVLGSVAAGALIARCAFTVRGSAIHPAGVGDRARDLARKGDDAALAALVQKDGPVLNAAVRAAMDARPEGARAVRDAAELAASAACARWFRVIDPLNIIGNLGPLVGLAGTVWGMIIAFTQLAAVGGDAGPGLLSAGISKALFHTLLGLLLAIPCLLVFGIYRSIIDRHCTQALVDAGRVVDAIADRVGPPHSRSGDARKGDARKDDAGKDDGRASKPSSSGAKSAKTERTEKGAGAA